MAAAELKGIQEIVTLSVFAVFAWTYLGESFRWESRRRLRPAGGGRFIFYER